MSGSPVCAQFGCGLSSPEGWLNYDASPTLRMQRLPVIGALVPGVKFPKGVQYGDVVSRLPLSDGSVDCLYCSHVLEHLALEDCQRALRESFRVLKPGGVFRMVLPDLEHLAREYMGSDDAESAKHFMSHSLLGVKRRQRGLGALLRGAMGNAEHLWMWDFPALSSELASVGFANVRRASYHDSGIEAFGAVEAENRWENALGIQCEKPAA